MTKPWLSWTLGASILFLAQQGTAATINPSDPQNKNVVISLDGLITEGDFPKFVTLIANQFGRSIAAIHLNSNGGRIDQAVQIAGVINIAKWSTEVMNEAVCASACFLLFAAGTTKYATTESHIGVHGASNKDGQETAEAHSATILMARTLKELGVPNHILGKMVVTPPSKIIWLTPDDLRSMNVTLRDDPGPMPEQLARLVNPVDVSGMLQHAEFAARWASRCHPCSRSCRQPEPLEPCGA